MGRSLRVDEIEKAAEGMHRGGGSYIGRAQPLATAGFHEFR
jgi:hypothetical protein